MTPPPSTTTDRPDSLTTESGRPPIPSELTQDQRDEHELTPEQLARYDAFYRRHFKRVRQIATQKSGGSAIGEDLATDVMVVMFEKWDAVCTGAVTDPDTYVYGVLRNRISKHYERTTTQNDLLEKLFEPDLRYESAERRAVINIEADNLMVMLQSALTSRQRNVFVYHHVLGMKTPEIAREMDMAPRAVRKTLRMATKKIQDRYDAHHCP